MRQEADCRGADAASPAPASTAASSTGRRRARRPQRGVAQRQPSRMMPPSCAVAASCSGRPRRRRRRRRRLRVAGHQPQHPSDQGPRRSSAAPSCSPSAARAATRSTSSAPRARATKVQDRERVDGPNFNVRKEHVDQVALRDPQRRLLRRDHAREHRRRAGRAGRRRVPREVRRAGGAEARPPRPAQRSAGSERPRRGRRAVLDLGASARDPDAVRAALARRGGDGRAARPRARARRAPPRADAARRGAARRAEGARPRRSPRPSARGEDADAAIAERMRGGLGRRSRSSRGARAPADERAAGALATLPNLPDPTAADEDTVVREVGEAARRPRAADHLELAGDADRHGARRARCPARASPTCAATSCCSSSRSCAGRWRSCAATASSR